MTFLRQTKPRTRLDLTDTERAVLQANAADMVADLRVSHPSSENMSRAAAHWGPDRDVRASFLATLLTGGVVPTSGKFRSVRISGARIVGPLDLSHRKIIYPFHMHECYFDEEIVLDESESPSINLSACDISELHANQIRITGNLELNEGFTAHGIVSIAGGHISGALSLAHANMIGQGGLAVNALRLTVDQDVNCFELSAKSEVSFRGAHVGGTMAMVNASLSSQNGKALSADTLTVGGSLLCSRLTADGEVCLLGARIGSQLDLRAASLTKKQGRALSADGLTVERGLYLDNISVRGEVSLNGARIGGSANLHEANLISESGIALDAYRVDIAHDMICSRIIMQGQFDMVGAHIGGALTFGEAYIDNKSGIALNAYGANVGQNVVCTGLTARGIMVLSHAHVGTLSLDDAKAINKNNATLVAEMLTVDQDITGRNFVAYGQVNLLGARIGGKLDFTAASLINENHIALAADGITVDQDIFFRNGFTVFGELRLAGANIRGQFDLSRATLTNKGGRALNAGGMTITEDMICASLSARGEIAIHETNVGGVLILAGANLANNSGKALDAFRITVERDIACQNITSRGEISMLGARIGGQLDLHNSTFHCQDGSAFTARRLAVTEDVACNGLTVDGEMDLFSAKIGGSLKLDGARFVGSSKFSLDLTAASVGMLTMPNMRPNGDIVLTHTEVGVFSDTEGGWPNVLHLRGFTYDKFDGQQIDVRIRLRWLELHPDKFTPQLYDQLADVYERVGVDRAARVVRIAKQRRIRRRYNPLSWVWYFTVGYGYRSWQAAIWVFFLGVAGYLIFRGAYPAHMVAQNSHPQKFQPIIYTLDVLLPVIGLGQKSAWQPTTLWLLSWYWALTLAGWVLGAAVVAGLTGLLKRD